MAYLKYTTSAKVYGSDSVEGFPLILTENKNVHTLSLHYFLDKGKGVEISSLKTYAQHLVDFLSQLEADEDLEGMLLVDDDYLAEYKQSIINRAEYKNKERYAVSVLGSVLSYLLWLENNGYFYNLIGETPEYKVRISFDRKSKIKHPLTKKHKDKHKTIIVPRSDWIEKIIKFGPKDELASSIFELMIEYGKVCALRSKEICHLKISDLPGRETVEKKLAEEENVYLHLGTTKGGKEADIPVSHSLLLKTWDYIELFRHHRVNVGQKKARKQYRAYIEPPYVFLNVNGDMFSSKGFSNSVRRAFLKAVEFGDLTEDERVWAHGLRHHAITKLLRALDSAGVRRAEAVARTVSRHASDDTLEPYTSARYDESFK